VITWGWRSLIEVYRREDIKYSFFSWMSKRCLLKKIANTREADSQGMIEEKGVKQTGFFSAFIRSKKGQF
jgi:hypothetical protein